MTRADLVICGALHEGSWPAPAAPDALLAPAILRQLGVPGGDFRIGLSAHDLAGALGAPEVVLSYAARDAREPVIPSRFLLRLRAMLGKEAERDTAASSLAQAIDACALLPRYARPRPMPSPEQRRVAISVTSLDRKLSRSMEPRAATPEKRIDAIRRLSDAGVPVTVMFAPCIPGLNDHEMEAVLERAAQHWSPLSDLEVTFEANPTSVEAARLAEFRAAGANRVSLGVQALVTGFFVALLTND